MTDWKKCFVGVEHNEITFACVDDGKAESAIDVVEAIRHGCRIHYVDIKERPIIIGAKWLEEGRRS